MTVQLRASKQIDFDAVVAYDSHPTFTADVQIVDKKYVDDVAAYGVTWKDPVAVKSIKGKSGTVPTNPAAGDAWLVDTNPNSPWGTLGVAAGDIVEYSGTDWVKIVANSGGSPPDGTRVLVAASATTPFDGQDYKFGTYVASSSSWTFVAPADGDAVLVAGDGGYFENRAYVYDTTSKWIQIAGLGMYTAGDGISISGATIAVKLATNASPGLQFAGDSGLQVKAGHGITVVSAGTEVKPSTYGRMGFDPVTGELGLLDKAYIPVICGGAVGGMTDDTLTASPSPVVGRSYVVAGTGGNWSGFTVSDIVECIDDKNVPGDWRKIGVLGSTKIAVKVTKTDAGGSFAEMANQIAFWDGSESWTSLGSNDEFYGFVVIGKNGTDYALNFAERFLYTGGAWENTPRLATGVSALEWTTTGLAVNTDDASTIINSNVVKVVVDNAGGLTGGTGFASANNGLKLNPLIETAAENLWNGSNKDWTLTDKAMDTFLIVTLNGQVCKRDETGLEGQGTYKYDSSTKKISFNAAPSTNSTVQCYSFKDLN